MQSGELALHKDMVYQHVRVQLSEEQAPATVPVIFGATDSFKVSGDHVQWSCYIKLFCEFVEVFEQNMTNSCKLMVASPSGHSGNN